MTLPIEVQEELKKIASSLMAPGKGIMASDETPEYMGKRLGAIGVENTEENRRKYREVLFTADNSIGNYLSGIILPPETVYQKTGSGTRFVEVLKNKGIIAGVNVDHGLVLLHGTNGETITEGLDDLDKRCAEFKQAGCHFAKLLCALKVGNGTPSALALQANAQVLAQYAATCQAHRLVPIVEPAIVPDGTHTLQQCQEATEAVMAAVYKALSDHKVLLEGTVLKPSMVTPGNEFPKKATPEEVARATLAALQRTVPPAVAGIGFLSGGLGAEESSAYLNAINRFPGRKPWPLTFTFGRALQAYVPQAWKGKAENVGKAQKELLKRAKLNSDASLGKYQE